MNNCLRFVKEEQPLSGLFENVLHMKHAYEGEKSGLTVCCEFLEDCGYATRVFEADVHDWHAQVQRPRHSSEAFT
eukprot:6485198-Amphidinium_carterae.2